LQRTDFSLNQKDLELTSNSQSKGKKIFLSWPSEKHGTKDVKLISTQTGMLLNYPFSKSENKKEGIWEWVNRRLDKNH
jgi:hypothetical protein